MNLIKSTSTFSFYLILSRIFGYIRDLLIAIHVGSGPIADAFFVAFRIPNTFRRIFSEGTFNAAFVPSYSAEMTNGKKKGNKFANEVFNILLLSLFFLVLLVEIFMPTFVYLIAPGFNEYNEKFDLTISLMRITFPFLIFVSLSSFLGAILNTNNKFAAAAAAPIILNIFLIVTLLSNGNSSNHLVTNLSYSITISGVVQFLFLLYFTKNFFLPKLKIIFKLNSKIKNFFKKLIPSIFSSGVTQINILVGTIIASFQVNAVSYLYYADRIYQINLAIAGIALGTILLPNLSKHIKMNNLKKINLIQNKSLELSLFLSLPATFALLISSEEITSALFGYGSFDIVSVNNSAKALFYFALGLPAFAMIKVFSSYVFARQNTKVPFYYSFFSVILNIFLSVTFFKEFGYIIIPIATTISSWFNSFLLLIYLLKKNYFSLDKNFPLKFNNILLTSLVANSIFYFNLRYFENYLVYESSFKLLTILLLVISTFFIYLLLSILTKAFKISDIKLKY